MENLFTIQIPPLLLILVVIIMGMAYVIIAKNQNHKKQKSTATRKLEIATKNPEKIEQEEGLTLQTLAVITAAVAATINTRNSYTITTIKRLDYDLSPNWNMASKQDQMSN